MRRVYDFVLQVVSVTLFLLSVKPQCSACCAQNRCVSGLIARVEEKIRRRINLVELHEYHKLYSPFQLASRLKSRI